jgi:hypothetical protein
VTGVRCPTCGDVYTDGPALEGFDAKIACQLVEAGIRTGHAFRFLRKFLGLTQDALGSLLGVPAATIAQWESREIAIERTTMMVLGSLAVEHAEGRDTTLCRLRTLAKRARLPRTVQV